MRILNYAGGLGIATMIVWIMVVGRDLLVPFMISIAIWHLINILTNYYCKISFKSYSLSKSIAFPLALLTMGVSLYFIVSMVDNNIDNVKAAAAGYQENFFKIIEKIYNLAGIDQQTSVTQIKEKINIGSFIANIAGTIAGIAGNAGLILIYILFLFLEQKSFDKKLSALLQKTHHLQKATIIIKEISARIEAYVVIKTGVSLLTAIGCYIVLKVVGVDYADFWAFIIFLLNFIPTVGSMLAVLFPALLCLVQFSNFSQFFIVIGSLGGIQFIVGNIIEPKLMGKSLNISPIVVMLSLSIWGSIWGIAGMFLSVPFTVILMIIFAQFETTKPIAILLSEDGSIDSKDSSTDTELADNIDPKK